MLSNRNTLNEGIKLVWRLAVKSIFYGAVPARDGIFFIYEILRFFRTS